MTMILDFVLVALSILVGFGFALQIYLLATLLGKLFKKKPDSEIKFEQPAPEPTWA